MKKALLVIDIQNDFLPGGALGVPEGDQIIPLVNQLIAEGGFDLVVATQDWHPLEHGSFISAHPGKRVGDLVELGGVQQVVWPVHCVEETSGAAFAPGLNCAGIDEVVRKGTRREIDSYSGFFDNGGAHPTGLETLLRGRGIADVTIVGLATDYCVKFTALDAVRLGFRTHLVPEACRGVELNPGDIQRALDEMTGAGVRL